MLDRQYVRAIYERHGDALYRLCYLYMKNPQDASDAAQNALLKLMEYNGSFESEEHEKNWLLKVGVNECRMLLRHWWRKRVDPDAVLEFVPARQETGQEDGQRFLLEQVLALPEKYRIPIYMYYYEGYSTMEISVLLQTKEATVRSWLRRGRILLKEALE